MPPDYSDYLSSWDTGSWVRFCDLADGGFVAVELRYTYQRGWKVLRVGPARQEVSPVVAWSLGMLMPCRTIAIGDIHGCSRALKALLDSIDPRHEDLIVPLGDYIDRGPDSRGVLDQLLALAERCVLIPLLGNHEEMLLAALSDHKALEGWLTCGGTATVLSCGWKPGAPRRSLADLISQRQREFLAGCRDYYETDTHIFVHAGYIPDLPLDRQPGETLRWRVTDAQTAKPHCSGKVAVVGHTPQRSGEVLDLGFLKCIDTHCHRGGWLTALEVHTGQVWQADAEGRRRSVSPDE